MQEKREIRSDMHREARLLLRASRAASLAVIEDGYPALALVTPAVRLDGSVLLLLSQLSGHTRALDRDPRCALMVSGAATDANPQTAPRLSLACDAVRSEETADRERYLAIHPYAGFYAGFGDFGVYRLTPVAARYVGGFGRAATLDVERLRPATAALRDPVANAAAIETNNRDEGGRLDVIAAQHGGDGTGWRMITLDPDGFDLAREEAVIRIDFLRPLRIYADAATQLEETGGPAGG